MSTGAPGPEIRDFRPEDTAWAVALNNAAVPHVTPFDVAELREILAQADRTFLAVVDDAPRGLLILIREGSSYESPNYRFFQERHACFLYVDRIIVDPESHGTGIGRALYGAALAHGRAQAVPVLACEVNLEPPNPVSMRFHRAFGFHQVAERPYLDSSEMSKTVAMMELAL